MDAADPGEGDVAGSHAIAFTVEGCVHLPIQDEIRLLEGMVVLARHAIRFVLDHEHGRVLSAQLAVEHHLHGDAAVHEERRAHAGRYRQLILRLPAHIHVGRLDVPERPRAWIADVDTLSLPLLGRVIDKVRVSAEA